MQHTFKTITSLAQLQRRFDHGDLLFGWSSSNKASTRINPPIMSSCFLTARSSALGIGIVTVRIGADHREYCIHKALLMHHSEYFSKILQGPWQEASEGVVTLEDIDSSAFNAFAHWLYTQHLPHGHDKSDRIMETAASNALEYSMSKFQAYSLGYRFLATDFRRMMTSPFAVEEGKDIVLSFDQSSTLFQWMFEHIPSHSPLLQLEVGYFCETWNKAASDCHRKALTKFLQSLPGFFVVRVMKRYCLQANRSKKLTVDMCCYLEHTPGAETDACDKLYMRYDEDDDYSYLE